MLLLFETGYQLRLSRERLIAAIERIATAEAVAALELIKKSNGATR